MWCIYKFDILCNVYLLGKLVKFNFSFSLMILDIVKFFELEENE